MPWRHLHVDADFLPSGLRISWFQWSNWRLTSVTEVDEEEEKEDVAWLLNNTVTWYVRIYDREQSDTNQTDGPTITALSGLLFWLFFVFIYFLKRTFNGNTVIIPSINRPINQSISQSVSKIKLEYIWPLWYSSWTNRGLHSWSTSGQIYP